MDLRASGFFQYVFSKQNKSYWWLTLIISIVYFITLRYLYPIPSFYSDSFTWLGAAETGQMISYRPVGYSKLLSFFKLFSTSDVALIAAQYYTIILINLFLFFTTTWFFRLKKVYEILLFAFLIINPLYLLHSNYIYSDAFFNSLAILWFTLTIWVLYKPEWSYIILQLIVLACLFWLRYNAIFFPAVAAFGILLSNSSIYKKVIAVAANFLVIGIIILATTYITNEYTGVKTFSAFSGWQLANNAIHVLRHDKIDTSSIKDKEVKAVVNYTVHFFDTTKTFFPDTSVSALYMWESIGPLKKYMHVYPKRNRSYFKTWVRLGPIYSKFGQAVIMQHPITYFKRFVIPNAGAYFSPPLETYATYMEGRDTIPAIARKFYSYKSKKTPQHHPVLYAIVFNPMRTLFTIANILFLILVLLYIAGRLFKKATLLFNKTLSSFSALYVGNFLFVVFLAPTVFRYHIFLLTLLFPVLLYLLQQFKTTSNIKEV